MSDRPDGHANVVYAVGECSGCGKQMRAPVENQSGMTNVKVRCGRESCRKINTLREFQAPRGTVA